MYTGNCGHAFECNEWKTGCHNCPNQKEAINSTRKGATAWNWKKMKEAFEKGFKEATKTWGKELPDISQNTRDAVLKKFDDYFAGKNS